MEPQNSHTKDITISEESFLRLSNPQQFKYSNFEEWLKDNNSKRKSDTYKRLIHLGIIIAFCSLLGFLATHTNISNEAISTALGFMAAYAGIELKASFKSGE